MNCVISTEAGRWLAAALFWAVVMADGSARAEEGIGSYGPAFDPAPQSEATPPNEWVDALTGHRVVWVSRVPGRSVSLYFHQNAFPRGGNKMIYGNTSSTQSNRLYVVDLKTFKSECLVDADVKFALAAHKSRRVYYTVSNALCSIDVKNRKTNLIYQLPKGWKISTINADETLAAGVFTEGDSTNIDHSGPKHVWFNKIFEAERPSSLFTIDLRTGKTNVFHHYKGWLGHIQFSPTEPQTLMFCHEGPWEKVDRIWTINVTNNEELRLVHKRSANMEIAGHEFWSPDGKTIWFDLQKTKGEDFFLAGADLAKDVETRYPLERDQWSVHYNIARKQNLFAGDGGSPRNVAHATNGQWLWLFTPQRDGTFQAEHLCSMARHDYSLEPNVNFTPDGKWIIFRANFHGSPQVYAVEAAKKSAKVK